MELKLSSISSCARLLIGGFNRYEQHGASWDDVRPLLVDLAFIIAETVADCQADTGSSPDFLIDAALSSGALGNDLRLQFRRLQFALRPSTISLTCPMIGVIQAPPPPLLLHRVALHFVRPLHPSLLLRQRHPLLRQRHSLLRRRHSLLPWHRIK